MRGHTLDVRGNRAKNEKFLKIMKKPKYEKLIDLSVIANDNNKIYVLGSALYFSAEGTKHFYEALQLLSELLPREYREEFEKYKADNF